MGTPMAKAATTTSNLLALASGVGAYAVWYRLNVGPWCPAMWFGTAPLLMIGVVFFTVRRLLTAAD